MMMIFLVGSFLMAILLGMILIPNILLISHKKRLFDLPDSRKVHSVPIPRLGGLAFFPSVLITFLLVMGIRYCTGFPIESLPAGQVLKEFLFLGAGCMVLFLVGVADDLIGVGYRYKFLAQLIAATFFIFAGVWINSLGGLFSIHQIPVWGGIALTLLIVVYITNAINLIDGIDGLASGLCCIALSGLAVLSIIKGEYVYAILALATLGVIIPFWFYNVFGNAQRGHKLFMGDTGSLVLGYILSFLIIHLSMFDSSKENLLFEQKDMVISFSMVLVPMLDVVRVVLHRLRTGKNPFLPDKNHFHHKLLRTGMRVRFVMVTIISISLFFIGINVFLVNTIHITMLLLLNLFLWVIIHLFINFRIKKYSNKKSE